MVEWKILPEYFINIKKRLSKIPIDDSVLGSDNIITVAGGTDLVVQKDEEINKKIIWMD